MHKPKRKNDQQNRNRQLFLQSLIIALILCALLSLTNVAWFWWIPFISIGPCLSYKAHQADAKPDPIKVKTDDRRY